MGVSKPGPFSGLLGVKGSSLKDHTLPCPPPKKGSEEVEEEDVSCRWLETPESRLEGRKGWRDGWWPCWVGVLGSVLPPGDQKLVKFLVGLEIRNQYTNFTSYLMKCCPVKTRDVNKKLTLTKQAKVYESQF